MHRSRRPFFSLVLYKTYMAIFSDIKPKLFAQSMLSSQPVSQVVVFVGILVAGRRAALVVWGLVLHKCNKYVGSGVVGQRE